MDDVDDDEDEDDDDDDWNECGKCFYPIGWGSLSPGSKEERSVDPWTI